MSRSPAHPKVGDLQLLRGVAIVLVLLTHCPIPYALIARLPYPIAFPGALGVDLFFVISGYVIVHSLARDRFEPVAFFVRRVFRLTPALLLLAGMTAVVALNYDRFGLPPADRGLWLPAADRVWWVVASVVGGYYLLGPRDGAGMLGVAWSLSVEDLFYAAVTVVCLLVAVGARRRAPRLLPGVLGAVAAGVFLAVTWVRLEVLFLDHARGSFWAPLWFLGEFRFDFLALGVLAGLFDRRWPGAVAGWVAGWGPFWTPLLLAVPLGLAAVCGSVAAPLPRAVFGLALPVAGACFTLLVLTAAHEAAFPAARGRLYRVGTYLGDRSYTIYLFHMPVYLTAMAVIGIPGADKPRLDRGVLFLAASLPVLLALVELIYRGVELPLTAVGRRLSKRLRVIPADAAPAAQLLRIAA